jgi:hypothetical protein
VYVIEELAASANPVLSIDTPEVLNKPRYPSAWSDAKSKTRDSVGVRIHPWVSQEHRACGPISFAVSVCMVKVTVETVNAAIIEYFPRGDHLVTETSIDVQSETEASTESGVSADVSAKPSAGAGAAVSKKGKSKTTEGFRKKEVSCNYHQIGPDCGTWTIERAKGQRVLRGEDYFSVLLARAAFSQDAFRNMVDGISDPSLIREQHLQPFAVANERDNSPFLAKITLRTEPAYVRISKIKNGDDRGVSEIKKWVIQHVLRANYVEESWKLCKISKQKTVRK